VIKQQSYVDLNMSLIKWPISTSSPISNQVAHIQCQRKALRRRIYICRQYYTLAAHAEAPLHEESSSQYLDSLYHNFSIVEKHNTIHALKTTP
jgi:hypothetical protein